MMGMTPFTYGQDPTIIKLNELQRLIAEDNGTVKVINFWATWCAPCIKELPYLEKIHKENSNVEVLLISLDLDLDSDPEKVYKFVERKGLTSKVFLLNEKDPNKWINSIDKNWSGALPATLIINSKTGKRKFIEQQLKEGELETLIDQVH